MTDDAPGTISSHMTEALVTLSWTSHFHAHRIMRGGAFLIEAEIFYSKKIHDMGSGFSCQAESWGPLRPASC